MELYLVRHGQTEWNQQNKVLGRTDIPLNEVGIAQAKKLSAVLSNKKIDIIYSSPLKRAKKTAEIIKDSQKGFVNVEIADELIEHDFGKFEGVDRSDKEYLREKQKFFSRYPNGESYFDVVSRVYPFLKDLSLKENVNRVLIVTHNGICRIITSYFINMKNDEFYSFNLNNCECKIFKLN